jgi:hypothetical protein
LFDFIFIVRFFQLSRIWRQTLNTSRSKGAFAKSTFRLLYLFPGSFQFFIGSRVVHRLAQLELSLVFINFGFVFALFHRRVKVIADGLVLKQKSTDTHEEEHLPKDSACDPHGLDPIYPFFSFAQSSLFFFFFLIYFLKCLFHWIHDLLK